MTYKRKTVTKYFDHFIRPIGNMQAIYALYWTSYGNGRVEAEQLLWVGPCNGTVAEAEKKLAQLTK